MKKVTIDGTVYSLTDEGQEIDGIEIDENTTDAYGNAINDGDTLVLAEITNPENDQRTIHTALVSEDDAAYETSKRQLTLTSQYHDWHNTTADAIKNEVLKARQAEDEEYTISQHHIEEYNEHVAVVNMYDDRRTLSADMDIDTIEEIIHQ